MKKTLLINGLIIVITSFLFNTAGISFRVFVAHKIGAEGMGLFQLITSVYIMAAAFVVSGLNVAVTRLTAELHARRTPGMPGLLLKKSFLFSILLSLLGFAALFFGAEHICTQFLHDERGILALKILSLCLPFVGISSCIKGYFYARSSVIRPTLSQALELIVQIFIIYHIIDNYAIRGLEYACAAIVLATSLAEVASCLYLYMLYRFECKGSPAKRNSAVHRRIFRDLLVISLPLSVSSLIGSGLRTVENMMIPLGLTKFGYTEKLALEKYGMIQGMVMPILFFPASILTAFSTLLIPEIAEANALHHRRRIHYAVSRVLQLTAVFSIFVAGILMIFADQLALAIYDDFEIGQLIFVLAPLIPLMYMDIVVDAMLKGLNEQNSTLKYNMIDSVFRILLISLFISREGVTGYILMLYASNFLDITLSICRLLKVTEIKMRTADWIIKPVLSVGISGALVMFLLDQIDLGFFPVGAFTGIGILLTGVIYLIFLMQFNCLTREDIGWFKNMFRYSKEVPLSSGLISKEV